MEDIQAEKSCIFCSITQRSSHGLQGHCSSNIVSLSNGGGGRPTYIKMGFSGLRVDNSQNQC